MSQPENPYESPLMDVQDASRSEVKFASAAKAFLAGAWRGAKLGAKWSLLILAIPYGILLLLACSVVFVVTVRHGGDIGVLLSGMRMIGMQIPILAYIALCGPAGCSVGIGLCEALTYWRDHRRPKRPTVSQDT